jgi:RNA polymerase sigma-70 factor (ECF subfamily)
MIDEGVQLVRRALAAHRYGPYLVQAAIAATHATASEAGATDWTRIVSLYDILLRMEPSPVVKLNRAVAVAMRDGPESGLAIIESLLSRGDLADYHLAHSAHADLCRRAGRIEAARTSYARALALARLEPERRFLAQRLRDLQ